MKKISILIFLLNLLFIFSLDCFASNTDTITIVDTSRTIAAGNYTSAAFQTKGFTYVKGVLIGVGSPTIQPQITIQQSNDGTDWTTIEGAYFSGASNLSFLDINAFIRGKFVRVNLSTNSSTFTSYVLYVYLSKEPALPRSVIGRTQSHNNIGTTASGNISVNNNRKYIQIINTGNQDLYVGFTSSVATTTAGAIGLRLVPSGSSTGTLSDRWTSDFSAGIYTGQFWLVTATGTTNAMTFEHD